jgi:hypothetical protein
VLEIFQEIWAAIYAGLMDSLNPGALTILLEFSILMYFIARVRCRFLLAGSLFIFSLYLAIISISWGWFDPLISQGIFDVFWDAGYFILILLFLFVSVTLLRDRWVFLKERSAKRLIIWFDFFERNVAQKAETSGRDKSMYYYLMILCGFVMSLLAAAWPQNVQFARIVYQGMLPGNQKPLWILTAVYGLAFVSPLIILFVFYCLLRKSPGYLQKIHQSFSMVQMILAAVFLGFAVHLSRYYL